MLELNLLPVREARRQEALRQLAMQGVFVLMIVGAGIGFVQSGISSEITLSNSRVHQMQRDIDQYKPQLEQVEEFRKTKKVLKRKIEVIEDLDLARSGPVRILSELGERVPDRLWLSELTTKGKVVMMKGSSLDNDIVALFLRQLDDSKYFDEVDLDQTEFGQASGDLRLVKFSIRAVLVNPDKNKASGKQV
jgi:type IV pilus assembly protein PilN